MAAHYAGMRGRCLNEAALCCVLVPSLINKGEATARWPAAQLEARLPHGSVLAFIAFVTAQLLGEPSGKVIL